MKIKVFLLFFLVDGRIRITDQGRILEAQKLTDPDLEYYLFEKI
jgi:hypothetical protein